MPRVNPRPGRTASAVARTFAGIAQGSVPLIIGAQIIGAAAGLALVIALFPHHPATGDQAVTIHPFTTPAIQETR